MTYELTAPEAALIEAYRKLFPMAQEHISGLVISMAKLHTLAQRSGRERKPKREAVEGDPVTYELTKQEAALVRAYRKLPQTEQGYVNRIVPSLVQMIEIVRKTGAEWERKQEDTDEQKTAVSR